MSNKQIIELEWFTREDPKPQYNQIICIHYVDSVDGEDYGFFFGKRILKTSKDFWNKEIETDAVFNVDENSPYTYDWENIKKWCYSPFHN